MLAPWSAGANSVMWLRAALSCLTLAAVLAACGDDPTPTPAPLTPTPAPATPIPATATPTPAPQPWRDLPYTSFEYILLAELDPPGREAMIENAVETLNEYILVDSTSVDAHVRRGVAYTAMYYYSWPDDRRRPN